MGAGQSSDRGSGAAAAEVKTSYYELLGLQRHATDDEVKKAYRRKALELHPDRNYGNEETATSVFAEVSAAYEVLSDPQERAWYDSHESAILRGDDGGDEAGAPTYEMRATTADDLARIVRKFNSSVEFSDAPSGFYGFLRETFEQLVAEEDIAANWEGTEAPEYPSFGHKDDSYDDVVKRFYSVWSSFSTVKSFSWKDKYRLSEAPDRWYRRRMEQENRKFRQDGVREFNDAVRSLIAFVRKRDPRYIPSTQTEDQRQQTLRDAAAAQAARARAANEAKWNQDVPDWTKNSDPEELEESSEDEVEVQILECVACNKEFKSEKQWEAHERSKKHQRALYALQKKMRTENAMLDLDNASNGVATPVIGEDDELDLVDDHAGDQEAAQQASKDDEVEDDFNHGLVDNEDDGETPVNATNDEPAKPTGTESEAEDQSASENEDGDYASLEAIQARMVAAHLDDPSTKVDIATDSDTGTQAVKPKIGKAAQKRAKKAAAAAAATAPQEANSAHKCEVCNATFPSNTKLFQHIKELGHAALKSGKKGKGKR